MLAMVIGACYSIIIDALNRAAGDTMPRQNHEEVRSMSTQEILTLILVIVEILSLCLDHKK